MPRSRFQTASRNRTTFLQVNLGRGRIAQNLCLQTAAEHRADILLLSEQCGSVDTAEWYEDASGRAAIMVVNPVICARNVQETSSGFVAINSNIVDIFSCYFSPNDNREKFAEELAELEIRVRMAGEVIITGDFNAKSPLWGEWRRDWRGQLVEEMISRLDLAVITIGGSPTFRRGNAESIIDLTLASQQVARRISGWEVLEKESLSDHSYILFHLDGNVAWQEDIRAGSRMKAWNAKKIDPVALEEALEEMRLLDSFSGNRRVATIEEKVERVTRDIARVCDSCMPKRRTAAGCRRARYWWTEEIADLRKECVKAKRRSTRSRGDRVLIGRYKEARQRLKKAIKLSKNKKWRDLLEEVENDPWGFPYKLVCKRLGANKKNPALNDEHWVKEIIKDLFPSGNVAEVVRPVRADVRCEERFTVDDLKSEGKRLQSGKSPGPDGIPNEILQRIIAVYPEKMLDVYNECLRTGSFPKPWKKQKLILLRKGDKPLDRTSSYRPICLLDTMGKVLEGMLLNRLEDHMVGVGGFSGNQFGFRRGLSTVDAIKETLKMVQEAREQGEERKGFCAMIAIDIRNAFNSLRWPDVLEALRRKNVPEYLRDIVEDYLHQRQILHEGDGWFIRQAMTRGAPQGSRLGPFFWKVVYDDLLEVPLPGGVKIVGFADDSIIVVEALEEHVLEVKMQESIAIVERWLTSRGLEMAVNKTEAVLVTKRRTYRTPRLVIDGVRIDWKKQLTYLGVEVDRGLSFGPHVMKVSKKAAAAAGNLSRLMPNVGGPTGKKRRLYASVVHSILLYAAPVWVNAMTKQVHRKRLLSVQRQVALRVAAAYRTVSAGAVMVVASIPPIDLLAWERSEIFEESKAGEATITQIRRDARDRLLRRWQDRWDEEVSGRWTYRLIPDLHKWMSRGYGETSYYLTQALTGHGSFRAYLHRFRRSEDASCLDCEAEEDDAEHAIFHCRRWMPEREVLGTLVGSPISPDNLGELMVAEEAKWKAIEDFVKTVMKTREAQLR